MRILETAAHFHFHFVDQGLGVTNLRLDFARFAQQRAKLPGPPTNKGRLVLPLEVMPLPARPFQTRLRARAFGRRALAQALLLDPHNSAIECLILLLPRYSRS
ncbi:MAG: hypothetical protein DME97_06320 [Verrucomicrobia bacterium]|nr:MAG: hypothetical protein DME97_06320 [Verrucomicrobiota bacterium]